MRTPQTRIVTVDSGPVVDVVIDCVTSFGDVNTSEVTKFEIETGAVITDHVKKSPRVINLEVIISDSPIFPFVDTLPPAGEELFIVGAQEIDMPILVGKMNGGVLTTAENRANQLYAVFLDLLDSSRVLTIENPLILINSINAVDIIDGDFIVVSGGITGMFVLTEVGTTKTRETGKGLSISLSLTQLRIVQTKTAQVPKSLLALMRGKKDAGKKESKPADAQQAAKAQQTNTFWNAAFAGRDASGNRNPF